jgi:hypothetical protein
MITSAMLKIYTPKMTAKIKAELEALAALPDDTIDLSDMPEVTDWSGWTRGKFYCPVKERTTTRSDSRG